VPGVIELAEQKNVFIGGDDFKSGFFLKIKYKYLAQKKKKKKIQYYD
jgi:hypothetical protein